ncbi:MBL fold metallo-hydrolase [Azospirillum sp. ST 5-10]|uniref:MBL fold metallo-hydrolase n=1 Tax=unclassified Azospirillum TaxID=2630922 RepID=UPI003F4A0731
MPIAIDRRRVLAGAAALAAAPPMSTRAVAAAPRRFSHGAFGIEVFSDGFITLPGNVIAPDASPAELADILARLGGRDGAAPVGVNIPLIRAGDELILVDTGSGDKFQPSAGRLRDNLLAAGVDPAAVTMVVLTHAHPDHAGGVLLPGGALSFPNAAYVVAEAEWAFWMNPDFRTAMPAALHGFALGAQRDLGAVRDRLRLVRPGDEIVAGIRALGTPGHTPGHIALELAGDDGLVVTGDAITNVVVSFEHPRWRFGFDTDQELAIRSRATLIERAAAEKLKLLGYHWTAPGFGIAERRGGAYRFVALG